MEIKPGEWFKEEWDDKAPEPGRTYYLIEHVENGLVSLRRFAIFERKPEMNAWTKVEGVEAEKIARRLKTPVSDPAEIQRVQSAFEVLPESMEPL